MFARAIRRFTLRARQILAVLLVSSAALPSVAQAFHVVWDYTEVQTTIEEPSALITVDVDLSEPYEPVAFWSTGLQVVASVFSLNGDGSTVLLAQNNVEEFGAPVPTLRAAPIYAADPYGTTRDWLVIAGTPPAGTSPWFRIYDIDAGGAFSEVAEVELAYLDASLVGEVRAVADLGDVDGNGIRDLAFGFPDDNRVEIVFLDASFAVIGSQTIQQGVGNYDGNFVNTGAVLTPVTIEADDDFGWSIERIADLDNGANSAPSIAIGIPGFGNDAGLVSLVQLDTDGTVVEDWGWNGQNLMGVPLSRARSFDGPVEDGGRFGSSLARIPEFQQDIGTPQIAPGDLLIGAPGIDEMGLVPDPDPMAVPREDVGAIVMVDVLLNGGINQNNWIVIGDKTGGLCRSFFDGHGFGAQVAWVGDVRADGVGDYLVLGGSETRLIPDQDLLLLDMLDAKLWRSNLSAPDGWDPPGPPEDGDRLAILGIADSSPSISLGIDPLEIAGFKVGSCYDEAPLGLDVSAGCYPARITEDAVVGRGGYLKFGNLEVASGATLTNFGVLEPLEACGYDPSRLTGNGTVELTAVGTLVVEGYFEWAVGDLVNHGLIHNLDPDSRPRLNVDATLSNEADGEIRIVNPEMPGEGGGFRARAYENRGTIRVETSAWAFEFGRFNVSPRASFVNHPGGLLDVETVRDDPAGLGYGNADVNFGAVDLTNRGTFRFAGNDGAQDWLKVASVVNEGTLEMVDSAVIQLTTLEWNGGSLAGDGGLRVNGTATLNADMTIDPGLTLECSGAVPPWQITSGVTLQIDGEMRVNQLTWTSATGIEGPGTLRIGAGGEMTMQWLPVHYPTLPRTDLLVTTGAFECAGTIRLTQPDSRQAGAKLTAPNGLVIEPTGSLRFESPPGTGAGTGTTYRVFNGTLINSGHVLVDMPPAWPTRIRGYLNTAPTTITNTGTIEIRSEVLREEGGFLDLQNDGALIFAEDGEWTGLRNYTQGAGASLRYVLGEGFPSAGALQTTGTATFEGDLNLETEPGYLPDVTDPFVLATFGTSTPDTMVTTFPAGVLDWQLVYDPSQLVLNPLLYTLLAYDGAGGGLASFSPTSGATGDAGFTPIAKKVLPTAGSARLVTPPDRSRIVALLDPGPAARLTFIDPETLIAAPPVPLTSTLVTSVHAIAPRGGDDLWIAYDTSAASNLLGVIPAAIPLLGPLGIREARPVVFPPGAVGARFDAMATSARGRIFAIDNASGASPRLWEFDTSTGEAIDIGLTGHGAALDGLGFLGEELWATSSSTDEVLRIDPSDASVLDTTTLLASGLSGLAPRKLYDVSPELRVVSRGRGGRVRITAPSYVPPIGTTRYELYRANTQAELAYGSPTPIDSGTEFSFLDSTTVDYTDYFYRVDVFAADGTGGPEVYADRLFSGPAVSRPFMLLSETFFGLFAPKGLARRVGEQIEIENRADVDINLTGYRLSNGTAFETLSGTALAGGFLVHTLTTIDLPAEGGSLSLVSPSGEYELDQLRWGSEGGAPAVPAGFTISRVPGTTPEDPDGESFSISQPTLGSANEVAPADLGSALVLNELSYVDGAGEDYVEIFNPTGSTVALERFALSDGTGFIDSLETSISLDPGDIVLVGSSGVGGFDRDLVLDKLYLYRFDDLGRLVLVDQVGWGPGTGDPAPPGPVAPRTAVQRTPDGVVEYVGDLGTNWLDTGGGSSLAYGVPSPGFPNIPPGVPTLTVDPLGGGDFTDIASAVSAATAGTTVLLRAGRYAGPIDVPLGVSLVGQAERSSLVIISEDPTGNDPTLRMVGHDAGSRLANLTVLESSAGALELVDSATLVSSVHFENNRNANEGGAVTIDGGVPRFVGCVFLNNRSDANGGAVAVLGGAEPAFESTLFVGNRSQGDGGAVYAAGTGAVMTNCVFDLNETASGGGAVHVASGVGQLWYSTVTNSAVGTSVQIDPGANGSFSCGLVFGNATGLGTSEGRLEVANVLFDDPQFCQPSALNYTYPEGSPLAGLGQSCGSSIGAGGASCFVSTDVPDPVQTSANVLHPAAPNPFNPSTRLRFELSRPGRVDLRLFDLRGRQVRYLVRGQAYGAGLHELTWFGEDDDGQRVASGVYLIQMKINGEVSGSVRRVALVK